MAKVLKLGFAMGGGVSLGTFCAGALSQAIKLSILYATYTDKNNDQQYYDSVEIDVFSGASAGAISLAIMLRALSAQSKDQRDKAIASLVTQYNSEFTELETTSPNRYEALISAQIMEQLQHEVWVERVNLDKLLEPLSIDPNNPHSIRHTGGILNRGTLENLAKSVLNNTPEVDANASPALLAKRVLYAASLTNITPILNDAREELDASKGGSWALSQGGTSFTHRETRVFDFHFQKLTLKQIRESIDVKFPERWVRYHLGRTFDNVIGSLTDKNKESWYRILSTALASGAFPTAFEPVLLERYKHEYGNALWPSQLKDRKEFSFTYVDGGTFNNEPIRDAFKLASFIDAYDERESDRLIMFVDPAVPPLETNLTVPGHKLFMLKNPSIGGDGMIGDIDGIDLERKTSLDRLVSYVKDLAVAIIRQSRSLEGDKIYAVRKQMQLRDDMRDNVLTTHSSSPNEKTFPDITISITILQDMVRQIEATMQQDKEKLLLPSAGLSVFAEAKRICRELTNSYPNIPVPTNKQIDTQINEIIQGTLNSDLGKWFVLLNFIQIDQSMKLSGKSSNTKFIAIGPFKKPEAMTYKEAKMIDLPGSKFSAFGGFMFQPTRELDMNYGKNCALKALKVAGCISTDREPEFDQLDMLRQTQQPEYDAAIAYGVDAALKRLTDMISESNLPFISNIPALVIRYLLNKLINSESIANTYEFRLEVPTKGGEYLKLEFDGRGKVPGIGDKDIKPVDINGKRYLITFADYDETTGKWSGPHVTKDGKLTIDQHRLIDRLYTTIALPDQALIKKMKEEGYAVFKTKLNVVQPGTEQPNVSWHVVSQLTPLHLVLAKLNLTKKT